VVGRGRWRWKRRGRQRGRLAPGGSARWQTEAVRDLLVVVAALAVVAILALLVVAAFVGLRQLRRFFRGEVG
jgi:hypothetical protein